MGLKEYLLNAKEKLQRSKKETTDEVKVATELVEKLGEIVSEEETLEDAPKSFVSKKLDELLDEATDKFFPKNGTWYSSCFHRPETLEMINLPCHLRDDEWLAKMFRKNQNLGVISSSYILDYVKNSLVFQEARHNYELEIVRWQINWMRKGGENWVVDEELGGDFFHISSQADLAFRRGVVTTLTIIGMDREVVEEGIEKNADLWRDKYMALAFNNEFNSIFLSLPFDIDLFGFSENKKDKEKDSNEPRLDPIDPEHKDAWLKMRKYEYYQRHKASVDKYGVVLPEMMMTDEEVTDLRNKLEIKNAERKQVIKEYQEAKERVRAKRYGNRN